MPPLVTNSSRKIYQTCKRLYRYKYVDCIRPEPGTALKVGTLCHIGFECFWRGMPLAQTILEMNLAAMPSDQWWGSETGAIELARARALIKGYYATWAHDCGNWELVSAEETIVRDVAYYKVGCKLDALARHKPTGQLWLIEHKTTSEEIASIGDDYWERLAFDGQIALYAEAAAAKYVEPISIMYDVAKKGRGKPKLKKRIVRKKDESDESLEARKAEVRETLKEFEDRLTHEATTAPGMYARPQIHRTADQAREIMQEWHETAREMVSYQGTYPRNESACNSRFGKCAYMSVCSGTQGLDDPKFVPIPSPHPELDLEDSNAA